MSRKGRSSLAESAPAPVFAALGDKTRLVLVAKLCGGQPQSICLFAFEPEPIEEIKAYLDHVSDQWGQALTRLKSFVED